MQHCNTATRQRDKDTVYRQVLEPILAAKILIFADIGKLFVLFFLVCSLIRTFELRSICTTFELCSKVLTLENTKKTHFSLYFARLFVPLQPISRGACECRLR